MLHSQQQQEQCVHWLALLWDNWMTIGLGDYMVACHELYATFLPTYLPDNPITHPPTHSLRFLFIVFSTFLYVNSFGKFLILHRKEYHSFGASAEMLSPQTCDGYSLKFLLFCSNHFFTFLFIPLSHFLRSRLGFLNLVINKVW